MNRPDQDRATAADTDSKNSPTPPPPRLRTVSRTAPAVDVAVVVNASKKHFTSTQNKARIALWIEELPSVLCRCWLDGRKGIRPVKN